MPVEVKPLFHPDAVRPHLKAFQVSLHEDPPKLVSETVHPGYWEKWHADNPRSWGQYAIDWVRPTVWGHWIYESLTPSGRVVVKKFSDGTIRVIYEEPAAGPLINQVLTIEGLRAAAVGMAAKKAATAEAPATTSRMTGAFSSEFESNLSGLGKLASREVTVTPRGLQIVEQHLSQFGEVPQNTMMLQRLNNAMSAGQRVSGADAVFYTHEVSEASMMARGLSYEEVHAAAMAKYQVSPYHPDVIQALPESFNDNWFSFWGIKR